MRLPVTHAGFAVPPASGIPRTKREKGQSPRRPRPERTVPAERREPKMAALLLLLLVAILFGLGFVVKALLWVALVMAVLWVLGWGVRPAGGRWYYWWNLCAERPPASRGP